MVKKLLYFIFRIQKSTFSLDSFYHVTPPTIIRRSKDIYKNHVSLGTNGPPQKIPILDKKCYQYYVQQNTQ